jgi:CubicO group peptidase (beta-lactamase class C family)
MKSNLYIFTIVSLLIVQSLTSQSSYFPSKNWEMKSASDLKINPAKLDSAVALALRSENKVEKDLRISMLKSYALEPDYKIIGPTKMRGGSAGLVIKGGYIVAEWGDVSRVDMAFSVTKSFLSTVAGLAVDQGLIAKTTDKVGAHVWDATFEGEHNSKVTWQHLLHQSSDWSGTLFGLHDWADRPPKEGGIDQWKNRKILEPGTTFEYNDVRVNLLAYSLLQVFRKPLPQVLKESIMDPIGASTTWRWNGYDHSYVNLDGIMMQSVSGGGHHGGGMFISAQDMARLGLLYLRNGNWKGRQLISKNWIAEARKPSAPNTNYGYMWWLNTDQKWKGVSPKVYYAAGYGGNYIVVDEENDLVIVTRWITDDGIGELVKMVIESVK